MSQAITELPKKDIKAVFTDLDDTLTIQGQLPSNTYSKMWDWKNQGKWLVIVSGRPAGWADALMRLWPIDAMIFENGAGIITREGSNLVTQNLAEQSNINEQRTRLNQLFLELKKEIPALKLASDQHYRLFDYAIDFNEEEPKLSSKEVDKVMGFLEEQSDITVKLSSIHVNYWVGKHTKVTACEHLLETQGTSLGVSADQVVFSGDSPNDEPLFKYFAHSVGVANIAKFLPQLKHPPAYITENIGGSGFCEIIEHLL